MTTAYAAYADGSWVDQRGANLLDSGRPWYDVYETSDGKWMSVGAIEDKFYAELVRLLELSPDEADRDDPAGWPALRERLAARFASRTRAEWEDVFTFADACVAPVLSLAEAPKHPHHTARGTFVEQAGRDPDRGARFADAVAQPVDDEGVEPAAGSPTSSRPGCSRRGVSSLVHASGRRRDLTINRAEVLRVP